MMLSGAGGDDRRRWGFRIDRGNRAGEETTIGVPSNWELEGFGELTYGQDDRKTGEVGEYELTFELPEPWRGRRSRLVFEGVMTDATVTLNGESAGPTHQGGFTRFSYEDYETAADYISSLFDNPDKVGGYILEAIVACHLEE